MIDGEWDAGNVEIKLGESVFRGNYEQDLKIDERQINNELKTQPSKYVFWARMCAIQRVIVEKIKTEKEAYEAQVYTYLRNEKEARGAKVTERYLENKIRMDEKFRTLHTKYVKARLQLDILEAVVEAFRQRVGMLMSLGANLREEWNNSLAIKEAEFEERRRNRKSEIPCESK